MHYHTLLVVVYVMLRLLNKYLAFLKFLEQPSNNFLFLYGFTSPGYNKFRIFQLLGRSWKRPRGK